MLTGTETDLEARCFVRLAEDEEGVEPYTWARVLPAFLAPPVLALQVCVLWGA